MINGCDPSTCRGGCDKDMSGIMVEGHFFRFASCQFGQKTAGSPLGAIVRSVARYFARLPTPVHVASWVDDLIFIMSTPEHGDCAGFTGGCAVCEEYYGRALRVQALWQDKARKLNIPLSAKGHSVAQVGTFTGVGIDTLRGRFYMLPDKLESMHNTRSRLAESVLTTPRTIAGVRGKALHYGCAIPYVALAAPSLSQAMYGIESGVGPTDVPSLDAEKDAEFDWDKSIPLSGRASRALAYLKEAMDRHGSAGQPLWPIITSSFYGAFLAGDLSGCKPLVITYDASIFGWGAIARTSASDPGFVVVGGFREAAGLDLPGAAYLEPAATADNAIVPRFFARHAESLAEGQDALTQPDWGRSLCPHCGLVHREFAFVFPPRPPLAKTVAKARADGLWGVMVLPFATADPVWLRHHSPTSQDRSTRASSSPPARRMCDTLVSCLVLSVWRSWLWTSRGLRTVGSVRWRHPVRRRRICDLAFLYKARQITLIDAASRLPCIAPAWVPWRALVRESTWVMDGLSAHVRQPGMARSGRRRITHVPCPRRPRTSARVLHTISHEYTRITHVPCT